MNGSTRLPENYIRDVRTLLKDQIRVQLDHLHKQHAEVIFNSPLSCGLVADLQVIENNEGGRYEKMAIQFSTTSDVAINDLKSREIKLACSAIETFIYDYEKGEWVGNTFSAFLDIDLIRLNSTD